MEKEKHPVRKKMRWEKQDYSHPGEYAITICVKDNKQILSRVVPIYEPTDVCSPSCESELSVGAGVLDRPYSAQVILTPYGKIAEKYIKQLDAFYKNIRVIKYVIMPSHIHLLLRILYDDEINELNNSGTPRTSSPTKKQTDENTVKNYSVISNFVSTFKRFCNKEYGKNIWQRSFYDHVIRDDNDLTGAETYIDENPAKWLVREEI